jgi:hypothetical protein
MNDLKQNAKSHSFLKKRQNKNEKIILEVKRIDSKNYEFKYLVIGLNLILIKKMGLRIYRGNALLF